MNAGRLSNLTRPNNPAIGDICASEDGSGAKFGWAVEVSRGI